MMTVKRGEIYYADLSPVVGSEQGGIRPVLIIQNDVGNRYSPTVIAAAITSRLDKAKLPTHISLRAEGCGLRKDSVILLEQIRTIDKQRLKECMGEIGRDVMQQVDYALEVSFGLIPRSTVRGAVNASRQAASAGISASRQAASAGISASRRAAPAGISASRSELVQ